MTAPARLPEPEMHPSMVDRPGMLAQVIRFGAVGGLATLTHVGVAIAAEAGLALSPQSANLAGYLVAVVVSYTGHALVTFKAPVQSAARFMRFILVSLLGLATSSTTVWVATGVLGLAFPVAMLCVAVAVPVVTYIGMRFWVFDGRTEAAFAPGDVLVPVGLGLGVVAVFWDRLVNHDIAWYLFATRDWLAGARLYEQLVEVNPPLNFYLTVPSLLIADATGLGDMNSHYVAVALLLAATLLWCGRILREAFPFGPAQRALFLLAAGLAVVVTSLQGIGQREQVMVLAFLPWALREAAPRPPSLGQTVTSAGFAAVGMCLKPHFALLPIFVTLLNCLEERSLRPVLAPANLVFLTVGLAYVGFVWSVHTAYLTQIVPLAMDVYGDFGRSFPQLLSGLAISLAVFNLWAVIVLRGKPSRAVKLLTALALGSCASYFLQGMGFNYHKVPFNVFVILAAVMVLLAVPRSRLPMLASGFVVLALGLQAMGQGFYRNRALPRIEARVAEFGKVDSLITISAHVYSGPPVAMALGADWSSSYPHNWLVPGAIRGLERADCVREAELCARLEAAAARNRTANIADIARLKPDLLIVDSNWSYFEEQPFDWLAFLAEDPAWPPVFADYSQVAQNGRFLFFRRQVP